jgi:SNF2 family DNA or RNA helicase
MIITLFIIRETLKRGEKVLIFSQALFTLDLLEDMLHTYFG